MEKQKDKKIRVYFCPKCKSFDVKYVFGLGNLFGVIPKQRCNNCRFEMSGFPVLITTKNKLEEDFEKRKLNNDLEIKNKNKSIKKKIVRKQKNKIRGKKR